MSNSYYSASIFETYNARHLTPEKVAKTFVPPTHTFAKLASNNNHIVVGPRGSGKTTLLKMLTLPALLSWNASETREVLPKVDFIGVFIPADKGWHSQIGMGRTPNSPPSLTVGGIAFTTHVMNSLATSLSHLSLFEKGNREAVSFCPQAIGEKQEREISNLIAENWRLNLPLQNFAGLQLALRSRLAGLKMFIPHIQRSTDPSSYLLDNVDYATIDYREALKFAISTYEIVSTNTGNSWALLFDEFELAPDEIQRDVLGFLRGDEAGNIVSKLALAPYNENFMSAVRENDSSPRNDYEVIDLWYPRKNEAMDFSKRLFQMNMKERGLDNETPQLVLGKSDFDFIDEDDESPYSEDGLVFDACKKLEKIDPSFREYMIRRKINLSEWDSLTENQRAQVRKFRSIVVTRNYFRSRTENAPSGRVINKASRKIHTIYTGAPTLFALCEGNPRILIGLLSPILRQLEIERQVSKKKPVDKNFQALQIKIAVNAFRALIKTIAHDHKQDPQSRGLLRLLDEIGDFFHQQCVVEGFKAQPNLSFTVPSDVSEDLLSLVGRALNMGAIIYVPDKGADPILTSLKGKRFRLSFLLAAYYHLPIMNNSPISLSQILKNYPKPASGKTIQFGQIDLFEEYAVDI